MKWFFLCLSLGWVQLAYAGVTHDSSLSWRTASSEHFRVHFHDGEDALMQKTLRIAESVYQRLTVILNWQPQGKTDIVLSDETDASNGFAMPIPSNRETLFVSVPSRVNSLEDHAGWLETLILHEFVHTLHLDKAEQGPKNIRKVFGRIFIAFPNVFMPAWMHEGLATYYETDKILGIGRGQSSYFQMMMRMEVAGGVKPLRQINQPIVSWPLLTSRYLYGVYFHQFLADTYGEEIIPTLVQSYSDHWLPFAINTLYEDVLAKDLSQVWDEFEVYVNRRFQPQLAQLEQNKLEGIALTQTGDFKRSVYQAKDGRIFFVSDNLTDGSQLMQIKDGEHSSLLALNWGASMDWHEQAGLLVSQPELCRNANSYNDLYRVDADTGKSTRLTVCQRYIAAVWSADGEHILAVKNEREIHALHLLDVQGHVQEVLWQGKVGEALAGIDWSADGRYAVSSVWQAESGWDVQEFDMQHRTWHKLTHDMHIKADTSYVDDSRDVLFSMDKDGVYNVYRLHRDANALTRLTRAVGGVFSPKLTENGLLSVNYSGAGFDVHVLPKPRVETVQQKTERNTFAYPELELKDIAISEPLAYSPWDSVLPTSWLPNFAFTDQGMELGAFVFGTDVLNRHSYSLYAGYQSVTSSPVFTLDYIYDEWFPLLKLHAENMQTPSFDSNNNLIALTENQRLDAELIFPWLQMQQRWSVNLGVSYETSDLAWLHPAYVSTGLGYQDVLAGVALMYDTRLTYPRGVSNASTGGLWSILAESGSGLGGDYTGSVASLAGREYISLGHEQVLAFRLDTGLGSGSSRPFRLGGTSNSALLPSLISPLVTSAPFNKRSYSLRGYGEGKAALIGQNMMLASMEYRFPIVRIERGWMSPPLGIHQVFGQVFSDAGRAWNDSFGASKTYVSAGVELGADAILFYSLPIRLQLGYAKGFDNAIGDSITYFRIGSSF